MNLFADVYKKMCEAAIKVIMENIQFSITNLGDVLLTFKDCARLRQTCRGLSALITKYWVFNFTRLDYRVYCGIVKHGLEYLRRTHNFKKVKRFLQIFGYVYEGEYPLHLSLEHKLKILHMEYGADPHHNEPPYPSLFERLVSEYDDSVSRSYDIDYILTRYPVNLNTYKIWGHPIAHLIPGRCSIVMVFLKHGLDCNHINQGSGLLLVCCCFPNIVEEILKYPINTEILENDLTFIRRYAERFHFDSVTASCKLIEAEIQRRQEL